jgi:hypothetical protein
LHLRLNASNQIWRRCFSKRSGQSRQDLANKVDESFLELVVGHVGTVCRQIRAGLLAALDEFRLCHFGTDPGHVAPQVSITK